MGQLEKETEVDITRAVDAFQGTNICKNSSFLSHSIKLLGQYYIFTPTLEMRSLGLEEGAVWLRGVAWQVCGEQDHLLFRTAAQRSLADTA